MVLAHKHITIEEFYLFILLCSSCVFALFFLSLLLLFLIYNRKIVNNKQTLAQNNILTFTLTWEYCFYLKYFFLIPFAKNVVFASWFVIRNSVVLFPLPAMRYLHKRKQHLYEGRKHKYVNKARERERQNTINGLKTIMNDFLISVTLCVSTFCV